MNFKESFFVTKTTKRVAGIFFGAQFKTASPHLVDLDKTTLEFLLTPIKSSFGSDMNGGFQVGRNADAPVRTLCGREITEAIDVWDRMERPDWVCKTCSKKATVFAVTTAGGES